MKTTNKLLHVDKDKIVSHVTITAPITTPLALIVGEPNEPNPNGPLVALIISTNVVLAIEVVQSIEQARQWFAECKINQPWVERQ